MKRAKGLNYVPTTPPIIKEERGFLLNIGVPSSSNYYYDPGMHICIDIYNLILIKGSCISIHPSPCFYLDFAILVPDANENIEDDSSGKKKGFTSSALFLPLVIAVAVAVFLIIVGMIAILVYKRKQNMREERDFNGAGEESSNFNQLSSLNYSSSSAGRSNSL